MEFRLQGYESEKFKNLLRVTAEMENSTINDASKVKITQLKKVNEQKTIPFNQLILPLFHVMEPALFSSGNPSIIYQTILISGSLGIVSYLLALIIREVLVEDFK